MGRNRPERELQHLNGQLQPGHPQFSRAEPPRGGRSARLTAPGSIISEWPFVIIIVGAGPTGCPPPSPPSNEDSTTRDRAGRPRQFDLSLSPQMVFLRLRLLEIGGLPFALRKQPTRPEAATTARWSTLRSSDFDEETVVSVEREADHDGQEALFAVETQSSRGASSDSARAERYLCDWGTTMRRTC